MLPLKQESCHAAPHTGWRRVMLPLKQGSPRCTRPVPVWPTNAAQAYMAASQEERRSPPFGGQ